MTKLVVVRHGTHEPIDSGGWLDDNGQQQMSKMAHSLKPIAHGSKVVILSSPLTRCRQGAEILAATFMVKYEMASLLKSSLSQPEDLSAALDLVEWACPGAGVLILVTHLEFAELFPPYYSQQVWGRDLDIQPINKGEACVIDCVAMEIQYLR